jgi:hypothetical protein
MKKLFMICAMLFCVVAFTQAQDAKKMPTPQEAAQKRAAQLEKNLKLSADQKAKAEAIYLDQFTQFEKLRGEAGEDKKGLREKSAKLNADSDVKLDAILTADQKTAYAAWKEEMKAKKKAGAKKESN